MKKRILHVIASLGGGGAEAVLHNLWPSLCRSYRYEFELCVLKQLGNFGERLAAEGATIHCLDRKRKYDPFAILKLRSLIRHRGYSIVHAHLFPEQYIVAMATAGLKDVRLVFTEHRSTNRRRNMGSVARWLDKLSYSPYHQIICVNSSTQETLLDWQHQLSDRAVVIPNSVRASTDPWPEGDGKARLLEELGLPPAGNINLILFASRLHHQKGVDVLLSALSKLKMSNYLCLIAGEGEERQRLEHMCASLKLEENVRFLGFRSDVTKLLGQVDFIVLPSRYEGMPLIILEAMSAGCPIIATSVDGTAEVLDDEYSALLVSPESDEQLSSAIQRLIDDPLLRRRIAGNALADAQNYLSDNTSRQLIEVYDRVLGPSQEKSSPGVNSIQAKTTL